MAIGSHRRRRITHMLCGLIRSHTHILVIYVVFVFVVVVVVVVVVASCVSCVFIINMSIHKILYSCVVT